MNPNKKQPLGIPPGSVHALLALSTIGAVIYCVVAQIDAPEVLKSLSGMVVGYYFGKRVSDGMK